MQNIRKTNYIKIYNSKHKMQHQDWETVIINKSKPKQNVTVEKKTTQATITSSQKPAWKIEKMVDSDEGKPINLISSDTAKAIIGGRVAAKLTQKQLAQQLNISEKEIKDIESGKAVENKLLISKIKRRLHIEN